MNRNTLIALIIGIILLLGAGIALFSSSAGTVALQSSTTTSDAEATFVNLTAQLEPIGFDTSILSDPRFTSLVDIHTAIVPEPTGRRDPFAPI